ncbi:Vacuolar protein sorting-associated protein 70 [Mucor velutinosus]|uniref:Vacuolar protein sorting-associated protein 70 n=1 Tax=Mucor velutinosus TaxID=708070 RepID=A0AAN7D7K5_9FUNG|nr:Vacuolar protein sorting-associated protein 70 [Mucor velutinosus]
MLNTQFNTKSSLWTPHCGIIPLNTNYTLQHISEGIDSGRFILASLHLTRDVELLATTPPIATLLNIYGRASAHTERTAFYSELLDIPIVKDTITNTTNTIFIMGDFNYQYKDRRTDGSLISAPVKWTDLLDDYYIDVFGDDKHDTWHSGRNAGILDYIFCSSNAHHLVASTSQQYLSPEWTDHELLGFSYQFQDSNGRGPGVWKANPYLARNKDFRKALAEFLIDSEEQRAGIKRFTSPQQQWVWIKAEAKLFIKQYQVEDLNWRKKQLHQLLSKRNKMMRHKKHRGLIFQGLDSINQQIQSLQHSIAEIEILKAGKFYREHGEKSPGFLKRSAVSRENRRSIVALRDPSTGSMCQAQDGISAIANNFYTALFTPEALDSTALSTMIRSIPQHLKITSEQQEELMLPIDVDKLLADSKHTRRLSSPGPDGLPYEILYLIMKFPPFHSLINLVYNEALAKIKFPPSWNKSVMCLLYKKGDPAEMKNYRPLSLANSDYKLFTRNINRRIMAVFSQLISHHQLGFIPGRFITENGMICQLIMEDAQRKWTIAEQQDDDPTFRNLDADNGLLLDQEKAYDRVNLDYLKKVLTKFGFPRPLIKCIYKLMGNNLIRINLNGHMSTEVAKLRGLRQGDPLSPILYNLAFEPFLLAILHDRQFHGYTMGTATTRLLCYADDALVFVHDAQDLSRLQLHMSRYCAASNAKFNCDKVQAFSVSGRDTWDIWQVPLSHAHITHLHSVEDDEPLIYLGFPLVQSRIQRINFMGALTTKIKTAIQIHSARSLSVVGKATVLNSLLLSKLWYVLRVTPLTQPDVKQLRSLAIFFLRKNIFPVIPWKTWTLPKDKGGLSIVDIQTQASALYFRWLHPLLVYDQSVIDAHPVSYLLSYHLRNKNGYQYHHIPLLFPSARRNQGLKTQRTGTVDMLYRAVDYLPKSYDAARINTATAMAALPLQAAFYVPPSSSLVVPRRVKAMIVSDVFQYDARLNFVHCKDNRDPSLLNWKRAPSTVFKGLASAQLKFQPYFHPVCSPDPLVDSDVSFAPLVHQFCLHDGQPLGNAQASAKTCRKSVLSSMEQPLALQNVSASRWKFFWSLSLTYIQRNVIYRLITGCIPSRSRLHYMMPGVFESHNCPVCLSLNETASHLLFDCPSKEKVWLGVIFEFLWPTTSITDIKEALLSLDFWDIWYSQVKGIHPYRILLITLSQIWLAHMRFVFDNIILVPEAILVNVRSVEYIHYDLHSDSSSSYQI